MVLDRTNYWEYHLDETYNNKGGADDREYLPLNFVDGENYYPLSMGYDGDPRGYQASVTTSQPSTQPTSGPYATWTAEQWDNRRHWRIPKEQDKQTCDAKTPGIKWFKEASSFIVTKTFPGGTTQYVEYLVVDNDWYTDNDGTVPLCHRDPPTLVTIPDRFASANINAGTQQQKGNDHGSSPDQAQLKEDVTPSSSTQTPSPVDDSPTTRRGESQQQDSSPTVHELEAMVMDLQAEVTRLTDLVTKLLKENAELRHDNAVLSMMVDANQDDGDIVDEIVDEATDTTDTPQQDTHVDEEVSTPSTQSTPTYDLSGYQYADIAPDGRPRITSTAATHSHPPTRKVFLNEWARFYDEHRGVEWWDCAGWTLYQDPVVDVPMSSINANPNEHCDLRNSEG